MIRPLQALSGMAAAAALWAVFATAAQAQIAAADGFSEIFDCSTVADETQRLACYDAAVGRLRAASSSGEVAVVRREDVAEVERDGFGFDMPALPRLMSVFGVGKDKKSKKDRGDEAQVADVRPERESRPDRITGKKALTAPVIRDEPAQAATAAPVEAVRVAEAQAAAARQSLPSPVEGIREVEIGLSRTKTLGYKKQRFFLENGQVWDQVDNQTVRLPREGKGKTNTVEIRRAALDSYLLRINGSGKAIRVRRRQ